MGATLWLNGETYPGSKILEEVLDVEHHLHNRERWCGISADQGGEDWALEAGLTVFRATSGLGVFGAGATDAAKIISTDDTPFIAGMTRFDVHRVKVHAASNANPYVLRFVWDATDMATGEAAGRYSDVMISDARKGGPVDIIMPRLTLTDKVWCRAKNGTDDATIDFFIGLHEYVV